MTFEKENVAKTGSGVYFQTEICCINLSLNCKQQQTWNFASILQKRWITL